MRPRPFRAAARVAAFLLLTALLLPPAVLAVLASWPAGMRRVRSLWCKGTAAVLGVRLSVEGRPFADCPTLFVANHVSYLDVLALGSALDGTFVAKDEIAGWALFGTLARVTGTLFVRRHWRQALIQRNALAARMRAGESFILFGEGTSSNGLGVLRFKTTLLGVAEPWVLDCPVAVQAVTLAYVRLADGTPFGPANCDRYAWHGDAVLVPHLLRLLHEDGIEVQLVLHEPVLSWSVQSRKVLGRQLQAQVAETLARCRSASPATAQTVRDDHATAH
jgi:1-acyl-sn-glycerol-3-phosphate acyltransferase